MIGLLSKCTERINAVVAMLLAVPRQLNVSSVTWRVTAAPNAKLMTDGGTKWIVRWPHSSGNVLVAVPVRQVAMQKCGNCLEVWYCGEACQKRHWPRHKHECLSASQGIIKLVSVVNTITYDTSQPLYYWGNTPAVDVINLSLNEGSGYARPLSLLFCGAGDPRNVALSLASLPESYQEQLTFVLNDITVCTLARTVLLLYMLWKGAGQGEAQTVTQVWYSLRISDHSYNLLTYALQRLLEATSLEELTRGVMSAPDEHFKTLKRAWQKWLHLGARDGAWVTAGRSETFNRDLDDLGALPLYFAEIPSEHRDSVETWFKAGILLPRRSRGGVERENVTLTGSYGLTASGEDDEFTYCLASDSLPFSSWDYKDAKAFHNVPSLLKMYSEYVSHVLAKCASRLVSGKVKVHCILSNCLEMQPFIPEGLAFDRILTSNLCDYLPLPALLGMCRPLLNKANPSSVIVTETFNWFEYFPEIVMKIAIGNGVGLHANRALQDTRNPLIANSISRNAFEEYYDLCPEFQMFLRASLLSEGLNRGERVPSLKALALKHGLILRNYLRNGNKIFPFRWPINCRRVTLLKGFQRVVEWVLPADK